MKAVADRRGLPRRFGGAHAARRFFEGDGWASRSTGRADRVGSQQTYEPLNALHKAGHRLISEVIIGDHDDMLAEGSLANIFNRICEKNG